MTTLDPELERVHAADGVSHAVTLAFADRRAGVCGMARAGRAGDELSALAVLFHDGETVAVRAAGGLPAGDGEGLEGAAAGGVTAEVVAPLERWRFSFDGGHEGGFELEATALGEPAVLDGEAEAATAGGSEGYDHLCRVRGTVSVAGRRITVDCLGQRGHAWGGPDWSAMSLVRNVSAWMADDLAVVATSVRPARAKAHDSEALHAVVLHGSPPAALAIAEPRLSTTYDGEDHQRRAGLELWPSEEGPPRRAAGELWCGTSLELGRLRYDVAFFDWRMEGRQGVGRYDVLHRT